MFQSSYHDAAYSSSILDISCPEHQASSLIVPPSSQITSLDFEIHAHLWSQKESNYEISRVLLFKGIPEDLVETEILTLCQPFGCIKDIFIKKEKRYVFLQFERLDQAQRCYETFNKMSPVVRGYTLYAFCTGKDRITKPNSLLGPPSRFLLFAFNKSGFNIESSLIAQLLAPYGRCAKIAIYQSKNTQAFVEMEDVIQAIRVKESLDGQVIFNAVCIGIFYTEEKDAFAKEKDPYYQGRSSQNIVGLSTAETLEDHLSFHSKPMMSNGSFNNIWSEPKNISSCIWPTDGLHGLSKSWPYPSNVPAYRSETSIPIKSPSLIRGEQFVTPKEDVNKTMNLLTPIFHIKEEKSPTILLLKNLPRGVTARLLFRLFGMYGNVLKVKIFFKNPENALIEYQTAEQAELAKTYLNNCPVYGNNIFVTNSKQGVAIDTSALKKGEETQYMGDYTTSPEHRYKFSGSKNHLNIVPPSKVLHLSNLCDDKDEEFYFQLFKNYGTIMRFSFLRVNEKMILMEMANIEDAVKILSNFHNFNINGKYLKVSFSKYQKIKDI